LEDQTKINRFARHNAKWEELKDDLKSRQVNNYSKKKKFLFFCHDSFLKNHEFSPIITLLVITRMSVGKEKITHLSPGIVSEVNHLSSTLNNVPDFSTFTTFMIYPQKL